MKFDATQKYGVLSITPTLVSQAGNYTLYVTLSDDNPVKPAKVQYSMSVLVLEKPKVVSVINTTITETNKPTPVPKPNIKPLQATITSISMKGRVTIRFSKSL